MKRARKTSCTRSSSGTVRGRWARTSRRTSGSQCRTSRSAASLSPRRTPSRHGPSCRGRPPQPLDARQPSTTRRTTGSSSGYVHRAFSLPGPERPSSDLAVRPRTDSGRSADWRHALRYRHGVQGAPGGPMEPLSRVVELIAREIVENLFRASVLRSHPLWAQALQVELSAVMRRYVAEEERLDVEAREALQQRADHSAEALAHLEHELARARGFPLGDAGIARMIDSMARLVARSPLRAPRTARSPPAGERSSGSCAATSGPGTSGRCAPHQRRC